MILVLSAHSDAHARALMSRLEAREGSCRLLDLSLFPVRSALTIDFGARGDDCTASWHDDVDLLHFADYRVVWWRRPQPFTIDPAISDVENRSFSIVEAHSAFSGLWLTLDAFWINHPTRDEEAARKVYQLKVAQQVGLRIPDTRITNDAEDARRFITRRGSSQTVYKAFAGTEHAWRETRLFRPGELDLITNVRFAPVIFQEYIPAGVDIRITAVGERLFPAAIHSRGTEYEVDFRMVMASARFEEITLPTEVTESLHALMQRLDLVYGAIDMRRTPDGEYVFLEINPAGQWLFVEERTGQPITEALVDLMLAQD
jgi:glutathione synthase/RimK-type ligase-like ATP-grasp enzyme